MPSRDRLEHPIGHQFGVSVMLRDERAVLNRMAATKRGCVVAPACVNHLPHQPLTIVPLIFLRCCRHLNEEEVSAMAPLEPNCLHPWKCGPNDLEDRELHSWQQAVQPPGR